MLVFTTDEKDTGERIDKVVARRFPDLGRRGVARLFAEGRVRVDGRAARKGDAATSGSAVEIDVGKNAIVEPESNPVLDVLLERNDVVILRKPAGQPTAPIRAGETGTLANAIVARYPETRGIGYRAREPGLLHRLDTQTSGLVVVARTPDAFERLRRALSEGRLAKRYLAVVTGTVDESGIIDEWLSPDPADPRRVRVVARGTPRARPATTRFRRLRAGGPFTLVEAEVSHAYRHQVRAHLAWRGFPIAGDALYGGIVVQELGARHALHASYVAWAGDDVVPAFALDDPLPAELGALLAR